MHDEKYLKHDETNCQIQEMLHAVGLRRSKDRHGLIYLFQQPRTWTAYQLHHNAHHTSLSTIYRNLQILEKKGFIKQVLINDPENHYEWAERNHHDHSTCQKCRVSECVPCPLPKSTKHDLQFSKVCQKCR